MVRGSAQDYLEAHPAPADVALVVEFADSSLELDRGMATVYGGGGVPVYWIVNLLERQVEVYTEPCAAGYAKLEILKQSEAVSMTCEGVLRGRIPVEDFMPRRRP